MNSNNRTHEALLAEIASLKNQIKETQETLRAENRYNRGLIDDCPDPLVILDLEGRITDINKTASEVTGYSRDDLIGTDFSDHFMEPEKVRAGCRQVLQKSQAGDDLLGFKHRDGRERVMFCRWSAYRNEMGQAAGVVVVACDVTQRRQATIQSAKEYNRRLIEASLDPMVTIGPDGTITDVNQATETVTGRARDEIIRTDFVDYFTEPEKAQAVYRLVFQEEQVRDYPLEIKHRDGQQMSVLYNASVYRDEAGQVIGVFAAARDVTKLKQSEKALRLSNLYNRSLVEASPDSLAIIGLDGKITDVNRAREVMSGYTREEMIGTDFADYYTEPEKAWAVFHKVFQECQVRNHPLEFKHRDGRVTPVLYNASMYLDETGQVAGVIAVARDITELKQSEKALRLSNLYNRNLIEASLDPLVTIGPDGTITDVNQATETVTGRARDEIIGTDFADYFTEPEKAQAVYRLVFQEEQVRDYPLEIKHREGHVTPVLYNASVYRDEAGQAAGVFAAARDVTKLKQSEKALRLSNLYNRNLIEASLDPLVTIGPDGTITDVNQATESITGRARNEIIGTDFVDYFTEPEKAQAVYRLVFQEEQVRDYPLEIIHREGHVTPVLYNASVYRDEAGQAAGVFAAARDITKLKQSEAALIHACNRERFLLNQLKNAMRDGFLLVNLDGTVLELNRNAAALLHVSLPEVTGKPMRSLCDKNRESLVYFIEELLQTGLFVQDREISGGDTGLKWYYSLDLLPLTEDGMTSALVIIRDLSRLRKLEYEVTGKYMFENMIGKSPAMRQVFTLIENLADADTTVLIQGPSGTGKELVAGALHYHGKRREEKYIRINCAAIPETLLESELFGHVRGAFTGATHDQIGRFELAHRGTLFIDEVGDIPLHLQVKLLRVLQERELERVGSTKTIKVDVRIIAATNRDLSALVKQNRFREDLYYRLAVVTIRIPPLRERREDIPLLVHHFITQMEKRVGRAITGIDSEAMEILLNHDWPGNVRQLENAIEHALVLTQNGAIHPHNLPLDIMKLSTSDIPEEPELSQSISPQRLREVLAAVNWNRSKAAEQLGVHRNTITRWIKEFHLSKPSD